MSQLKVIVCTLALMCASAHAAKAQTRAFVLGGGVMTQMRQVQTGSAADSQPDRFFTGMRVGGGVELRPDLWLDASLTWFGANTFEWPFQYLFLCCSIKRTTDRDVPLAIVLRQELDCGTSWCASVFGGGGLNLHRIRLQSRQDCLRTPSPCGSDFRLESSRSDVQPLVTFGLQLAVKAAARVQVVPSIGVILVKRPQYLSEYLHRGPENASGHALTVGASVMWNSRAMPR